MLLISHSALVSQRNGNLLSQEPQGSEDLVGVPSLVKSLDAEGGHNSLEVSLMFSTFPFLWGMA